MFSSNTITGEAPAQARAPVSTPHDWDYVIVGAGSAGCALAHELAGSGRRVLILEAGGADSSPYVRFPAGQIRAVLKYDWGYRSAPDPTRNGISEPWIRGRVLGGSSTINGTVFVRGAAEDFDRWSRLCEDDSWSADKVLPLFRALETSDQPGSGRGTHGPLQVRTVRRPHETTHAFVEAASRLGIPFNEDYNGPSQAGVAYAQLSQHRNGRRCSAADAFLKPLLGNNQVKLILHALVEKIEIHQGRATAVVYSRKGARSRVEAGEVILCAGAIDSPRLLMLSGIGNPEELRRLEIGVQVPLPGVGLNLREHPLLRLTYRTRVPTYNLTGGALQRLRLAGTYLMSGEGPIGNLFEAVGFLSTADTGLPDVQLHFTPVGYLMRPDGMIEIATYPSVTVLVNKAHPLSTGRVTLQSRDPTAAPLIECRLLENEEDLTTLIQAVQKVRTLMAAPPIADLVTEEVLPGKDCASPELLANYARAHTTIASHPAGTCRMGRDEGAVVGPDLRVHGIENLWVADASIMPDLISGNTNAACMMIGSKLGRQLLERTRMLARQRAQQLH